MIAAILLAAACIPIPGDIEGFSTVTPTIRGDHDRQDVVLFRTYAREPESASWTWVYDTPYVNDADYGEFATGILSDFPVQRMVPAEISNREVQFVIKAVNADGDESAPSNVVTICMPLCQEF